MDLFVVIAGTLFLVACALFARHLWRNAQIDAEFTKAGIKYAPGGVPFFGHVFKFLSGQPWAKMAAWSLQAGGATYFTMNGQRVLYVSDPVLIKRVLQTNQRIYRKDIAGSYKHFLCLLGTGLVTSEDEAWRKGRVLLSAAMRVEVLDDIPRITSKVINELLSHLRKGERLDVAEEFRHLTLKVIGQTVLSMTAAECGEVFPNLYLPIVTECNKRVWAPWRPFMPWLAGCRERSACLAKLDETLLNLIRRRWDERQTTGGSTKPDILDRCMAQLKSCDTAMARQLRDDIKTMLLAGHETSAAALTWATYELLCNPTLAKKIREEHFSVFPAGEFDIEKDVPTIEKCRELVFSQSCIREALRKYSVVPLVMRYPSEDDVVTEANSGRLQKAFTIPRGISVAVGIQAVHGDPLIWPEPSVYRPERFADMDAVDPYAFIPFINGPRNCLGQHLSLLETQTVLSFLFARLPTLQLSMDPEVAGTPHLFTVPQTPTEGLFVRVSS